MEKTSAFQDGILIYFETSIKSQEFAQFLSELLEDEIRFGIINWLAHKKINNLIVLKNIYVPIDSRNQKIGKYLIENFLKNHSNEKILTVVDNLESRAEGFNLEQWYIKYDFAPTGFKTLSGPIFIRA